MDPNDPWAAPPLPLEGDDTMDQVFTSVGKTLSHWEHVEGLLSLIFTHLIGLHKDSLIARRAYGSIAAFTGRRDVLESAASAYFYEHPDEGLQKKLHELIRDLQRASAFRNRVAHGIVQSYAPNTGKEQLIKGYCLLPGWYSSKAHGLSGIPTYAYRSAFIDELAAKFDFLAYRAIDVLTDIVGKHQAQTATRPQPGADSKQNPLPPSTILASRGPSGE